MALSRLRVNAWTEWGKLRTVVVGRADFGCHVASEPAERPEVKDPAIAKVTDWPRGPKKASDIVAANKQLDNLANIFSNLGINVLRPKAINWDTRVKTPMFEIPHQFNCVCPRDVMATIGNHILESSMTRRSRMFENLVYKDIAYKLFDSNPNMKWIAAPKCSGADSMYWDGYYPAFENFDKKSPEEQRKLTSACRYSVNESEIGFDVADMMKFGRDLFVLNSMTTNHKAVDWLKREFQGYVRVHAVHSPNEVAPYHVDCNFAPLRPPRDGKKGILLVCPERPMFPEEQKIFTDNDWELVEAPKPSAINYPMPPFSSSSEWLSMNVLSIAEDTILAEENETETIRLFERLGLKVIRIPFRDVYQFGGSLHCATWDIEREDSREDFFTKVPPPS